MSDESAKRPWVATLPNGEPTEVSLARLVDSDGGRDDAENGYYEAAADPTTDRIETAQRRFSAQFLLRDRHRAVASVSARSTTTAPRTGGNETG
ncbi:hypothetical protein [Cellulomonas septica]|uniref:Uncharacterized protein n=1 Tax=Cellulomonas septica TaxID=285080 RepID=A0ABX1JV60_9CELL|nr:hypothetical protein [Cellulomonas septica]NKY38198.1 hypothetical protein [Cellulomonas septica]